MNAHDTIKDIVYNTDPRKLYNPATSSIDIEPIVEKCMNATHNQIDRITMIGYVKSALCNVLNGLDG